MQGTATIRRATTRDLYLILVHEEPHCLADMDSDKVVQNLDGAQLAGKSAYNSPMAMPTMVFQSDIDGRMMGMTSDSGNGPQAFATASYTAAGQLYRLSYGGLTETRTYNSLNQLITQSVSGYLNITYNYSATQNIDRITSSVDGITDKYADQMNKLVGGTQAAQFFILLHELAHYFQAKDFVQNDPSTKAQMQNNDLVWKNCGKTVSVGTA